MLLTSIVHILSPETDNCPSWISGRERMTVENISWSISTKECCRPRLGLNPRPPGLQLDGASNWATKANVKRLICTCRSYWCISKDLVHIVLVWKLICISFKSSPFLKKQTKKQLMYFSNWTGKKNNWCISQTGQEYLSKQCKLKIWVKSTNIGVHFSICQSVSYYVIRIPL